MTTNQKGILLARMHSALEEIHLVLFLCHEVLGKKDPTMAELKSSREYWLRAINILDTKKVKNNGTT